MNSMAVSIVPIPRVRKWRERRRRRRKWNNTLASASLLAHCGCVQYRSSPEHDHIMGLFWAPLCGGLTTRACPAAKCSLGSHQGSHTLSKVKICFRCRFRRGHTCVQYYIICTVLHRSYCSRWLTRGKLLADIWLSTIRWVHTLPDTTVCYNTQTHIPHLDSLPKPMPPLRQVE